MRLPRVAIVLALGASLIASSAASVQGSEPGRAAGPSAAGVQLVGTPSVRYAPVAGDGQRYVSIAAVFRTDRALDRSRYSTIAAPSLRRGQQLPEALFGGLAAGRIGVRDRHGYIAETAQLQRRTRLDDHTWRLGLHINDRVTGRVKRVTLRRTRSDRWRRAAVARLGC